MTKTQSSKLVNAAQAFTARRWLVLVRNKEETTAANKASHKEIFIFACVLEHIIYYYPRKTRPRRIPKYVCRFPQTD